MMTRTRPTELHQCRVRLAREPATAAEARRRVRAIIRAWELPADPDIAVLLTSDLVTNAIMHGHGETITLAIRCLRGHLRIETYDTSPTQPMTVDGQFVTQTEPLLALIAALSSEWGSFPTPAGKAMYFEVPLQPGPPWPEIVRPRLRERTPVKG